jgi:hypothetical protein
MVAGLAAMSQNIRVRASGFFEGVRQRWQANEGPPIVDFLSLLADSAVTPSY